MVCRRCPTVYGGRYDVYQWWEDIFFIHKNMWIGDSHASTSWIMRPVYLMSSTSISGFKKAWGTCQLQKKQASHWPLQVDGTGWVHTLWLMKFCPKAGANLFSLTCKPLQGKEISSDHQNNIVVNSMNGDNILDHQIKTHDDWIFLRNKWWEGSISYCPLQEKYQWPQCWTWSFIWVSPVPLLRPCVSKTLLLSNHVKIMPWAKPNKKQQAKKMLLDWLLWERGFSLT